MKVGDYVRTKSGYIDKITNINEFREANMKYALEKPAWNDEIVFIGDKDVYKTSPNIIDLIQEGDYINGNRVVEHAYQPGRLYVTYTYIGGKGFTTHESYDWELTKDREKDIESIVTKEQFESMQYKVGE